MASSDILDSKNHKLESGDATFTKISEDIHVKPTVKLIGLTKEELEHYRNDPFWKVVRYGLFALFWLAWIAMFGAAVAIVILSPKCTKSGPKCDANLINYRVFTPTFRDSDNNGVGDFEGINKKLSDLKKIGVTGISPTPIFTTASNSVEFLPEAVVDIDTIEERFGGEEALKSLIEAAHLAQISVIADVPLTVSVDKTKNTWANGESKEGSIILDVANENVTQKLVSAAQKLLQLGVDGIRLTDYGLASTVSSDAINLLIAKIRSVSASDEKIGQKDVGIFVDPKWGNSLASANFSEASIIGDSKTTANIIDNIEKKVNENVELIRTNSTKPKSILKFSDVNLPRLDKQLPQAIATKTSVAQKAILTLQLIQIFSPGPISIYYGEELGLLSSEDTYKNPQRGLMRWNSESPSFGFTEDNNANHFANVSENSASVAFDNEWKDQNSQLNAFKNATKLRKENVFKNGVFSSEKVGDVHYYSRYIKDDDNAKVFILAVNWPTSANGSTEAAESVRLPTKLTQGRSLTQVDIKAHSVTSTNFSSTINLTTEELKLNSFEAVLLQINKN